MANELLVGVKIGAALSGSFHAAFGSAKSTLDRIGQVADKLGNKHQQLGTAMAAAMAKPISNIGALRGQYDRLGQTMDQLRRKQDQLTASIARGDQLKNQRKELRSDAMETVGTALAIGAPVAKSVQVAAAFQDSLRDTAITGEFSKDEEAKLGSTIRESALQWNQTQMEISKGMGVLVAGGLQDAKALEAYAPILAKSATATRARCTLHSYWTATTRASSGPTATDRTATSPPATTKASSCRTATTTASSSESTATSKANGRSASAPQTDSSTNRDGIWHSVTHRSSTPCT